MDERETWIAQALNPQVDSAQGYASDFDFDFAPDSVRRGDWGMRPGFGVKGARRQSLVY